MLEIIIFLVLKAFNFYTVEDINFRLDVVQNMAQNFHGEVDFPGKYLNASSETFNKPNNNETLNCL